MKDFENNRKILVIDDEVTNLLSVEAALRTENYEIFSTKDPLEGIAIFEVERPAVVILDLRMPVMDGLEVLRSIREVHDALFSVIILTGHGNKDDMNTCYDLGANAFLRKPLNIIELRGLVRNLMLLENYKRELNLHRDNLEGLVESRTEDLRAEMEERLSAQKKLEKSEKKYRYIFQSNTSGISISSLDGTVLEKNKAFLRIFDIADNSLVTLDMHTILIDPLSWEDLIDRLRNSELIENIELEMKSNSGEKIWTSVSLKLIDYDEKETVMSTFIDITETHRAREKLRQSEFQHRMLADLVADFIYFLKFHHNGSFTTEWIRGNYSYVLGRDTIDCDTPEIDWNRRIHPEDRSSIPSFSVVMEKRTPIDLEYRIVTPEGQIKWIRDRVKPCIDPETGRFVGFLGGVLDITEQKNRISILEDENSRLRQRLEEKE